MKPQKKKRPAAAEEEYGTNLIQLANPLHFLLGKFRWMVFYVVNKKGALKEISELERRVS